MTSPLYLLSPLTLKKMVYAESHWQGLSVWKWGAKKSISIWKVFKMAKLLIWELGHSCINIYDMLQQTSSWISISHNRKRASKTTVRLFNTCTAFWNFITDAFGWYTVLPGDIFSLCLSLSLAILSRGEKKILWFNVFGVIFWIIFWIMRIERNTRIFPDKEHGIKTFIDYYVLALYRCKLSLTFSNYNLTSLNPSESFLIIFLWLGSSRMICS